jgi:hypothetical protein
VGIATDWAAEFDSMQRHKSFVSTIEELLERKSSGSGQEIREYSRRDPPP